jgi:hypothetical protein
MLTRKSAGAALLLLALACFSPTALSQVPATVRIDWTLPTQNTDGTAVPATGANALAKVQGWISTTTAIPNTPTTAPTFTVTPVGVTTTQTLSVAAGSTIRVRLNVCNNATLCSALSNEVATVAPGSPGTITNVTIQITIT